MEKKKASENEDIPALLRKSKEGDREAFKEIVRLYQKKVFLLAFSFFRNREDAMDIVQETFLRFYQKMETYQEGKNFQNWILQIAKNLCIDRYRKEQSRRKELESQMSLEQLPIPAGNTQEPSRSSELKDIFARCLKRLAERQRMIFVLKHYNELQYNEIAQVLNISVGTAKSLHFKAVRNLRTLMKPYLEWQK